jgi:hypothetical protein
MGRTIGDGAPPGAVRTGDARGERSGRTTTGRALFSLLAFGVAVGAQTIDTAWTPDDIVVSNAARSALDPEFDTVSGYVAWQSGPGEAGSSGLLRVARIDDSGDLLDPLTGTPLRLGGAGLVLDRDLVPVEITRNGPEFALAQGGSRLLYTRYDETGSPALAQLVFDGAGWLPLPLERATARITPEGSKVADDPFPRMAYFGAARERLAVRLIDVAQSERVAGRELQGANFVPGEPAMLATAAVGEEGERQVFRWDYRDNTITQVTGDTAVKLRSPEPWAAPELDGETAFAVLARLGGQLFVRLYARNAEGAFEVYADVFSPDAAKPYLRSPRPFVYDGVSYLVFRTQPAPGEDLANDIWVVNADPDPAQRLYRRLNVDGDVRRADQEPVITASGPVVYYSELVSGAPKRTRRCRTGIAPVP